MDEKQLAENLRDYTAYKNAREDEEAKMKADEEIKRLLEEVEKRRAEYRRHIDFFTEQIERLHAEISRFVPVGEKRKAAGFDVSWRTTKSLSIDDPVTVVDVLTKLGKVKEGVKSFSLTFLRKLADAGVLSESAYHWEEKHTLSVKGPDRVLPTIPLFQGQYDDHDDGGGVDHERESSD